MSARRLVVLAFFVYVAVDLGCPLVPGAFNFDPQKCVDGVSRPRDRSGPASPVVLVPERAQPEVVPAMLPRWTAVRASRANGAYAHHRARDHVAVLADLPAADDH